MSKILVISIGQGEEDEEEGDRESETRISSGYGLRSLFMVYQMVEFYLHGLYAVERRQQLGMKILEMQGIAAGETCSSFRSAHSWSIYDQIHSQRPIHLAQKRGIKRLHICFQQAESEHHAISTPCYFLGSVIPRLWARESFLVDHPSYDKIYPPVTLRILRVPVDFFGCVDSRIVKRKRVKDPQFLETDLNRSSV